MASQVVPDTGWAPYAVGGLTGLAGIVAGWFQSRRKADVDESALVLTAWKNLMDTTEKRVSSLVAEVEGLQKRLALAENRITELEDDLSVERAARRALETENLGLKRTIAQHAQSNAVFIGASPNPAIDEQAAKLKRAGDNIRKGNL